MVKVNLVLAVVNFVGFAVFGEPLFVVAMLLNGIAILAVRAPDGTK